MSFYLRLKVEADEKTKGLRDKVTKGNMHNYHDQFSG